MLSMDKENGVVFNYPQLMLIPKGENETSRNKYYVWKNENGRLMVASANSLHLYNYEGYNNEENMAEFGANIYYELAGSIKDRPVFACIVSEEGEILAYEVINGFEASIDDYLEPNNGLGRR